MGEDKSFFEESAELEPRLLNELKGDSLILSQQPPTNGGGGGVKDDYCGNFILSVAEHHVIVFTCATCLSPTWRQLQIARRALGRPQACDTSSACRYFTRIFFFLDSLFRVRAELTVFVWKRSPRTCATFSAKYN